jgi:hypothetical protein
MKRQQARRSRRTQAFQAAGGEIDVPLPLKGLYAKARGAKVSNLFAATLENWRSDGVQLVIRPGLDWRGDPEALLHREPYEFGLVQDYIEITAAGASIASASIARPFFAPVCATAISSSVLIADGHGQPVRYDGTAFVTSAFTVAAGADPATLDGIVAHHDRVFLWKKGGPLEFYYGDVGAVTGLLTRFPLDRLGSITGGISTMISMTVDAGHGMNDVLCIVTTTGQLVIYEGLNPGDANDWRLTGRVAAARPLGPDAFAQIGSDVWMITAQGVVSLGEALRSSVLALVSQMSQPIADDVQEMVKAGGFTWQAFVASDGSMAVLNAVQSGAARQFIYHFDSQSWATGSIPAARFHNLGGQPEITGFDGRVAGFVRGGSDEMITATWTSSWFNLGRSAEIFSITPTIIAEGPLTVRAWLLSDNLDSAADIAESVQTVTLEPEEPGARVTLSDLIASDAVGSSFQITLEVTARWAQMVALSAMVG